MGKIKGLNKKAIRITDNIFDLIMSTQFHDKARKEMDRDLQGHNVFVDKNRGYIEIQDADGQRAMYGIQITKL